MWRGQKVTKKIYKNFCNLFLEKFTVLLYLLDISKKKTVFRDMIQNRQVFQYQNKNLIEKLIIQPPFRYDAIFQNEGCFLYIKGTTTNFLSSEVNMEINDGEAVILNCGVYFVNWLKKIENPIEIIAIHLYPDILKQLYKNELPKSIIQKKRMKQVQRIVPNDTIKKFIDSLEFYFQNPSLVTEDLLELKIKELILLLVLTKNATSVLEIIEGLFSPKSIKLKKVIELHKYKNLSIEELAILCNLSLSSFKREFNSIYKESPKNYLNSQKIQKAKKLLEISDLSVSEIAYKVGFKDPHYFTRLFKKKETVPPSKYRQQNKI